MELKKHIKGVLDGSIDIVKQTQQVFEELEKINKEYHYLNQLCKQEALKQARKLKKDPKGKLAGVFMSVKDCIVVKDVQSRAGSRILEGYKPPFQSTVIQRCIDEGAIIIGKTIQDEFGFGGFSTNVGLDMQIPLNPFDKQHSTGGSSGGSGGLTQTASFAHVSLGESTGGSIANPASFCGVYGLTPTYGRVSRYGLMDYGNSLDKIGPMARSPYDLALMMNVISGRDEKDSTSLSDPVEDHLKYLGMTVKNLKIGIPKEAFADGISPQVRKNVQKAIKKLEEKGATVEEFSLATAIQYGLPTYYLIATSEASTNLAKYCGMRYGKHEELEGSFNDYFTKVRSEHFGEEVKRRIMLGTFARMAGYRDAYYMKAMKVRTRIINEYKAAFKKYDVLISPTVPILPPRFDEIEKLSIVENYMIDVLTVGPNLAGLPHINIPVGQTNGLPIGMMVTADHLKEGKLIQVAKEF